ncbi:MAG TPA: prephenate dehydratase [Terriglobales bacterium]|nr:prephenate dehydratase [Terriglobales bacterium]
MSPSVAFQGEMGAYSEEAAHVHFGQADVRPFRTLRKVFDAVESKAVDYGIVPAENSIEGIVNQTYDLLLESPLKIRGEVKIRIEHCLLALPSTELRNIHVAYSHPQALAQCSRFLESNGIDAAPAYDTAGSAKMIHEKQLRGAAAIASERAAQVHELMVLQRDLGDYPENFTRFFVIGWDDARATGQDKTSIVFGTPHTPGSLHRALGELALRQVNLMKIESRPVRTTPWEYHFFVDIAGHRSDGSCAEALDSLRKATTFLKVLGSYPAAV